MLIKHCTTNIYNHEFNIACMLASEKLIREILFFLKVFQRKFIYTRYTIFQSSILCCLISRQLDYWKPATAGLICNNTNNNYNYPSLMLFYYSRDGKHNINKSWPYTSAVYAVHVTINTALTLTQWMLFTKNSGNGKRRKTHTYTCKGHVSSTLCCR